MSVKIDIPSPLRDATNGETIVEVAGGTVQTALDALVAKHPAIGPKIFDNGKLRPYINVFVNDEDIRYLDEMLTVVEAGQTIALIPAVAGG